MNKPLTIRRRTARSIVLSALIALGGCAQLPWQVLPTEAGIDQLCQQHRYITALKALDARKRSAPDYEEKRAAILAQLQKYQSELIAQAEALVQQQQFAKAEKLIEENRAELPASRELTQFDARLITARDRYVQRSLDDVTQLRAVALAREHAAYAALEKGAHTPELQALVARHQADVEEFAPRIATLGAQALVQNDYEKAAHYLAIANELNPSSALAQQLKSAELALAAERQKQQAARITVREQRYRELRNALQKSIADREFFAARDLLAQTRTLNTHTDELDIMQRELDAAIAVFVNQQLDKGNRLYTDGHIEDALNSWRAANALTPTPELQEKIDKAQKFIDRLQQLRKGSR